MRQASLKWQAATNQAFTASAKTGQECSPPRAENAFDIGGLTNGTRYYFRARLVNETGEGDWSAVQQGTPRSQRREPATHM